MEKNKIYTYLFFSILLGFFQLQLNAQTFLNQHYLSDDIENLINSNPDQALKIAQHLLSKTNTTNKEKAKINYLISNAYRTKGDYSSALNFLFEEKNYTEYLSEEDKINIEISKVAILRELSLDTQAIKILNSIESSYNKGTNSKLKSYLKAEVDLEKTEFLLKEGKLKEGLKLVNAQNITPIKNSKKLQELRLKFILLQGKFYLELHNLVEAKNCFELIIDEEQRQEDDNIYIKTDALYGIASLAFLKKDHNSVIATSELALQGAKKLNNVFLQQKIMKQENISYLALHDTIHYKSTNSLFEEIETQAEVQEQEAVNTAYNLISDGFADNYLQLSNLYLKIIYYVLGLFVLILLVCLFFWQKIQQRKTRLNEIINYIELTRNNLVSRFTEQNEPPKKNESKKNVILKETEEQILIKLKRFENSKRFINKDISLAVLAGQLDSNTKYLSEIINNHYNVNFNTYINKLRINYIIEKLKTDPNFINYKISYLAENCGFSSHSSFATVFKSITGISPVKFIELLNDEKENNLLE